MDNPTAIAKLERIVNIVIKQCPETINLRLHQNGIYLIKHRTPSEPRPIEKQIEGRLNGTVMPGAVLNGLSERQHSGYTCNEPIQLSGTKGVRYEMSYIRE